MATIVVCAGESVFLEDEIVESMEFVLGIKEELEGQETKIEIDLADVECLSAQTICIIIRLIRGEAGEAVLSEHISTALSCEWQALVVKTLNAAAFLQAPKAESVLCGTLGRAIREQCATSKEARHLLGVTHDELTDEEVSSVMGLLQRGHQGCTALDSFLGGRSHVRTCTDRHSEAGAESEMKGSEANGCIQGVRHPQSNTGTDCVGPESNVSQANGSEKTGGKCAVRSDGEAGADIVRSESCGSDEKGVGADGPEKENASGLGSADSLHDWKYAVDAFKRSMLHCGSLSAVDTVSAVVCMCGLDRLGASSPLRLLSEDLLCRVALQAGAILVPDECSLEEAIHRVRDYAATGQRILINNSSVCGPLPVTRALHVVAKSVLIQGVDGFWHPHSSTWTAEQQQTVSVCCTAEYSDQISLGAVGGLVWEGVQCLQACSDVDEIFVVRDGGCLFVDGLRLQMEEGGEGLGYWQGGRVVVRVMGKGSAGLYKCKLECSGATAGLAQGECPGLHKDFITRGGWAYEDGVALVKPAAHTRNALLLLRECSVGPCVGGCSSGVAASMRGEVYMYQCTVSDIGLDGLVAAVGGSFFSQECVVSRCGESGIVACGTSTYTLRKMESLLRDESQPALGGIVGEGPNIEEKAVDDSPVLVSAPLMSSQALERVGYPGPSHMSDAEYAGYLCGCDSVQHGGYVERSFMKAVSCKVLECEEEPLWASDGGLVEHWLCTLRVKEGVDAVKEVHSGRVVEFSPSS